MITQIEEYVMNKDLIGYDRLEGYPCTDCLIRCTCTKSIIRDTACDRYRNFIRELLIQAIEEYESENKT